MAGTPNDDTNDPPAPTAREIMISALNRLCRWRTVLAGWQLGTRLASDPECAAVRDQRELLLLLRVDVNALTQLLIAKGVFTTIELEEQSTLEAALLERCLEDRFPGYTATASGISIDPRLAVQTNKRYNFKS